MSKLVRMSSDLDIDISYDEVPDAKDYQFKINGSDGAKELEYTLKKGKRLPYNFSFDGIYPYYLIFHLISLYPGLKFEFTRTLVPTVAGFRGKELNNWWIFDREGRILTCKILLSHYPT